MPNEDMRCKNDKYHFDFLRGGFTMKSMVGVAFMDGVLFLGSKKTWLSYL